MNILEHKNIFTYKLLFFVTAISQIASAFFTSFSGGSNFNELLITPAGYTFAIWGAITAFSSIYALVHLWSTRVFQKSVYVWLSAVYVCFTLWLLAAERDLLLLTVLIFLFMYIALVRVFPRIQEQGFATLAEKIFLQGGVGMYLGWSSVAFIANIGVYVFSFGIINTSTLGVGLQMFLVLLAALSASYALSITKRNGVVFGTHWWAFVGILVGLWGREETGLLIVFTLLCVAGLNAFYFKKQLGICNRAARL